MISSAETAIVLLENFPELSPALQVPAVRQSMYRQLDCFALFTRSAAEKGRLALLKHCFEVADRLVRQGDAYLTRAMENVYLHCLHLDGSTYGNQLARQLMPTRLYQLYQYPHTNMLP
ncbi:hypothetical protein MUN84_08410 [Hymenobacter sp. 5516J-16]|uniref:DUF7674 domain-containing protein n=1 Tax=Hymenobacter sublimis TaxID=2933777 RepID=A0ABY4JAX9_9BACT|nr:MULTISPECIES: hypothetical protein [Hymenobacter]UOQ78558.1 hypothetical protein MUN84_08410 [Hymenobacter sp. 5516J-16]UPL48539.1 hypothetical protein MWH26_15265 [Hymenobacter sublimis]